MAHRRFNAEGRAILHQDFWDSASGFFEHVPALGGGEARWPSGWQMRLDFEGAPACQGRAFDLAARLGFCSLATQGDYERELGRPRGQARWYYERAPGPDAQRGRRGSRGATVQRCLEALDTPGS